MAQVFPFQPYRYSEIAGPLEKLVTQPYDKITPEMQARYLSLSPYNLVRVILGERFPQDSASDNVYTRAAKHLNDWIDAGVLKQDPKSAFYAYFQEFTVPFSGERLVRKGFFGLGEVTDYSQNVVHRHEQTLTGPKQDRWDLLEATRAFCEQIFMLYSDPDRTIDALLEDAATREPAASVLDELGVRHTMWAISDPAVIRQIQSHMSDKKLVIADGHHRYETAVQFRKAHPELETAKRIVMSFVNMHSPGLRILAAHRVVRGLEKFDREAFFRTAGASFRHSETDSLDRVKRALDEPHPGLIRIGLKLRGEPGFHLFETARGEELDLTVLHSRLLNDALGITPEAIREEKHLSYVRGIEAAVSEVDDDAQMAFLVEPTTVEQVARISLSGRVMPQKSTDFYPKLISGFTIYRLDH